MRFGFIMSLRVQEHCKRFVLRKLFFSIKCFSSSFPQARRLIRTWESQKGDAATTGVMLAALRKLNMNQIIDDLNKVL